jgi:hypothetical protein
VNLGGTHKTTLTGTQVGVDLDASQKIWLVLQALGNIAFAYSFSLILVEIQVIAGVVSTNGF